MTRLRNLIMDSRLFLILTIILLFSYDNSFAEEGNLSGSEMDLELEELFNIKVSVASKKEESISYAPGVVYVVTQDEIRRIGAIALKELLMMTVPGIGLANCSLTNRSLPVMRGDLIKANSSHILFLVNGRPIREVQEGGVNSDFIESFPVDVIERIEVIRGPGSVLYGSDAFSGVVNVITKNPPEKQLSVSLTGHFEALSGGGSTGTLMSKLGDVNIVASGRYYQKPDWNVEFLKKMFVPFFDITTRTIQYREVDSMFAMNIKDEGPGIFVDIDYKGLSAMATFVQWTTGAFQVPNETVCGSKLMGNVGYKANILDFWQTEINATGTQTGLLADDFPFVERKSNNMLLENTHFINNIIDNMNIVMGGTVSYIDGQEKYLFPLTFNQNPYMVSEGKRWAFSGYGQIDYTLLNKFKFIGGVQANKTRGIPKHMAPRIGVIWKPTERISLKALYSEAFRLPSINELFMNFNIGLFGNEKLKPEIVKTTDIGISYQNEKIMLGYNFFFSKQLNIIQAVLLSDGFSRRYENIGTVTFTGAEVEGKCYINKELYLNTSLIYQNNFKYDSTGRHINIVPIGNFIAKGGVSYSHPSGITVSLFNAFQSKPGSRFKGNLNNSDTSINNFTHINNGPFNLLSFYSNLNLSALFGWKSFVEPSLIFKIDNIIGKEIWMYEYMGYSNDVYPTIRGREYFLGLNLKI